MAATWFDSVTLYVEVAWDDTPLVAIASRTYTDHAGQVTQFDIDRGRTTELDTYAPGTASVTVYDPSRLFDSTNTAGTHYGKIRPMRPVRVRATVGATTYTVFSGFVTDFTLGYDTVGRTPTCTLSCVDGFQVLDQADMPGSAYGAEVLADDPINYWPLQDALNAPEWVDVADPTGDLSQRFPTTFPGGTADWGTPVGESTFQVGNRRTLATSLTTPAAIEFWTTSDPVTTTAGEVIRAAAANDFFAVKVYASTDSLNQKTARAEVRYSHGSKTDSTGSGVTIRFPLPPDGAWHICVTASSTTLTLYVNGVAVGTDTLAAGSWSYGNVTRATIYTQSGGDGPGIAHVACYSTAPSAARIAAHYESGLHAFGHPYGDRAGSRIGRILDAIDWPSADRDLSTGSTVLDQWLPAGGSALAACREIEPAEQGLFFMSADGKATFRDRNWQHTATDATTSQATFGDQAGEIRYTDDIAPRLAIDSVRNIITVDYAGGSVTSKDATSRTAYGSQRDNVDATLIPADAGWLARQLANYRKRARKDPAQRIDRITIPVRRDTATVLPQLLALDLGHRVTVNRRPTGGSGSMSLALTVQGIRHTVDKSAEGWVTELYLAPAPQSSVEAGYMIVGDATYGITGSTVTSY